MKAKRNMVADLAGHRQSRSGVDSDISDDRNSVPLGKSQSEANTENGPPNGQAASSAQKGSLRLSIKAALAGIVMANAIAIGYFVMKDLTKEVTPELANAEVTAPVLVPEFARDIIRDNAFLTARLEEVEKRLAAAATQPQADGNSDAYLALADEISRVIGTVESIEERLAAQAVRMAQLEKSIAGIAAIEGRMKRLEASQAESKAAQKPAPASTPNQPKPVAAKAEAVPVSPPWEIVAMSKSTAFVRNVEAGDQRLVRVGTMTAECGKVIGLDVDKQAISTERCAPVAR